MRSYRKNNTLAVVILIAFAILCNANANNQILGKYPIQLGDYGNTNNDNTNVLCFVQEGQKLVLHSPNYLPLNSLQIVSTTSPEAANPKYIVVDNAQFWELSDIKAKLMLVNRVRVAIQGYAMDHAAASQGATDFYPNGVGAKSTAEYLKNVVKENYLTQQEADAFANAFVLANTTFSEVCLDSIPLIVSKTAFSKTTNPTITFIVNLKTCTPEEFTKLPKVNRQPQFLP